MPVSRGLFSQREKRGRATQLEDGTVRRAIVPEERVSFVLLESFRHLAYIEERALAFQFQFISGIESGS